MFLKSLIIFLPILIFIGCGNSDNSTYNPQNPLGDGPAGVSLSANGGAEVTPGDLSSVGSFVILAKTGISDTSGSVIEGNIGVSPNSEASITNFPLVRHASNQYSTSVLIDGNVYASDLTAPTPANLTSAIGSMERAYTDAAGRTNPDFTELVTGNLGGLTLTPGLYKWSSNVLMPTTMTISGSATDIWIFQIAGNVTLSSSVEIQLIGGALAKNIFWQVAGQVQVGTNAHFKGIILCKTAIVMQTNSTLTGRAYAQTAVTLDSSTIIEP